jgi:hypothetical protein
MKLRLRCLNEITRVYFTRVSAQLVFVTGIKQQNDCFSGPIGNFDNGHQNKANYCKINIRDACGELASPMSQRTGHVVGPNGQYW